MTEPEMNMTDLPPSAPPTFVAGKARSEVVPLDWPLECEGRVIDKITVTRPTNADLEVWRNKIAEMKAAGGDASKERLPLFDVPTPVLEALDPDDDDRLNEVAQRFLPRRFRGENTTEPAPSTGGSTPSS